MNVVLSIVAVLGFCLFCCDSSAGEIRSPKWRNLAPGVLECGASPRAYALVDAEHCLLIGAPADVTPQNLPPNSRICELVLITHHHRDACAGAAAFVAAGVPVRASKLAAAYLQPEGVASYWDKSMPRMTPGRFPPLFERFWGDWNYLVHPTGIEGIQCDLEDGVTITWRDWEVETVATPGHSRDHVSFLARRLGGNQAADTGGVCFCGDAIYRRGQMWSPYTMEWHHQKDDGFLAAATSLRTLASLKPDLLLPDRGEPIRGPDVTEILLDTADRVQQLATLKNFDVYTKQVVGDPPEFGFLAPDQVGTANPQGNPQRWTRLLPHLFLCGNTYALASRDGPVMLFDPYGPNLAERVQVLEQEHKLGPVELVTISHGHNDHYTGIFALPGRDAFQVWALDRVADVVDHPHKYLAPYVDARVPHVGRTTMDGEAVRWREYELTFHHLPGQTVFTQGVELRVDGKHCLFTGDNFYHHDQYSGGGGWSGRNRGLPLGYVSSIEKILAMRPDWILAEHGGAFEFHPEDFRRRRDFALRAAAHADEISPHGDHRLDWDPQQVRAEPLICSLADQNSVRIRLIAHNPTNSRRRYRLRISRPELVRSGEWQIDAAPGAEAAVDVELKLISPLAPGRHVVPFNVVNVQHGERHQRADSGGDMPSSSLDMPHPSDVFVVLDR